MLECTWFRVGILHDDAPAPFSRTHTYELRVLGQWAVAPRVAPASSSCLGIGTFQFEEDDISLLPFSSRHPVRHHAT